MKLAGTFIKNTDQIISKILGAGLIVTDSYVLFEGDCMAEYPYLNATFLLLKRFDGSMYGTEKIINWTKNSPKFLPELKKVTGELGIKKIRIVYVKNNQTLPLPKDLHEKLSSSINSAGLDTTTVNHSKDLWLYMHEETRSAWLGIKVSSAEDFHNSDRKGVLRPQIAYMMNYLSQPESEDRVIDPFAGSGEIMRCRDKYFEGREFVSVEVKSLLSVEGGRHKAIRIDFFNFSDSKRFDVIVTDPPWGKFEKAIDIPSFYHQMVEKFNEILNPKGRAVVLVSREVEVIFEEEIFEYFTVNDKYTFKVWGMSAILYVLSKSTIN